MLADDFIGPQQLEKLSPNPQQTGFGLERIKRGKELIADIGLGAGADALAVKSLFRREITVDGDLGHARVAGDGVQACAFEAVGLKVSGRRLQHALQTGGVSGAAPARGTGGADRHIFFT